MPIQFVDVDGTLVIPSAVARWDTAPSNAGIATRGVIVLVGEAETGQSYSEEPSDSATGVALAGATFGPGQFSQVQAKYGSGPLVDAFRVAANPSRDPAVIGAPTQIITVKTNTGTKAQAALTGGYGVLRAKQAGALGNLLYTQVTSAVAEVAPALPLSFIHFTAAETVDVSVNGGTKYTLIVTDVTPAAFKATNLAALAAVNVALTGGTIYQPANGLVAVTAAVAAVGNVITVTLSGGTWSTQPQTGQVLVIADSSSITGAANANSGQYIVTSATPGGLVATKYVNTDGATLTPPVAVAPGATADAGMLDAYTILVFTNNATAVAGLGKSLSFYRSAGPGAHFVSSVTPVSTSFFVTSTAEAAVNVLVNRQVDSISETFRVGGNVVLSIGHVGTTTAPVIIDATNVSLNGTLIAKSGFRTLADLAAYISAQTNWAATVPAAYSSLPLSALDYGTFDANENGLTTSKPARIKDDAYATSLSIAGSRAVEFVVAPTAGIPAVQAVTFLSGGLKGGTTDAAFAAAVATAGFTRCNFVVPLFSRDATGDIADGLTDSASTYTIDGINAYTLAHVLQFSQFKKRRPRQAFVSKRDTYANVKTAAHTLANLRAYMSFLDVSTIGANGVQWFQPWMGSVLAAGMQAAGFYRPFFNKSINANGVRQAAGDFSTFDDDAVEDALLNGLGVIRTRDGGGVGFVSDQTTYLTDDNFVRNSVQAVYVADVIAMTTAQRMERAFVGQSFADVTAGAALSFLKGIMADLKRLKLIASSDDAVDGYKDASIQIRPPAMLVSAEVKIATGLYFVPIKFLLTEVQQTASQG